MIEIIELLNSKHVHFVSLDSGDRVDTTSPMGKAFFQIAGVFAELERSLINSRTKAGIEKAREKGELNKGTTNKLEQIQIFLEADKSYQYIAEQL